jgi:hypothetical protein
MPAASIVVVGVPDDTIKSATVVTVENIILPAPKTEAKIIPPVNFDELPNKNVPKHIPPVISNSQSTISSSKIQTPTVPSISNAPNKIHDLCVEFIRKEIEYVASLQAIVKVSFLFFSVI